jgi:hypothetical protein
MSHRLFQRASPQLRVIARRFVEQQRGVCPGGFFFAFIHVRSYRLL